MNKMLAFICSCLVLVQSGLGQTATQSQPVEESYLKTINQRAEKIVTSLGINDSDKKEQVQSIIVAQYRNLNTIHTDRDMQVNAAKAQGDSKEATEALKQKIEETASARISVLHKAFLAALSSQLTPGQVTQVKDGMTYNVVNITYQGYLDMIPSLSEEQKKQIRIWLEEAREQAMDAESSEKKHGWFGKYKGRINNYLSAAGYDLKKEREAWQKRIKEKETTK